MSALKLCALCVLITSGCATTNQQTVVGYVYTDGFMGVQHTFLKREPFTSYSVTIAEDACTTYTRASVKEIISAGPCVAQSFTSKQSPRLTDTLLVCSVVKRDEHTTQYCWVTDKAAGSWKPGMVTIDREPTTITYGAQLKP